MLNKLCYTSDIIQYPKELNMIKISARLNKGECCAIRDGQMIADTGNAPSDIFNGLTDSDEIFKKSVSYGYVDHHVIDKLPIMNGREPKCSTQMAVDYHEEVLKYIKEHNVKEVYIHYGTDVDALCAGWLIKYLGENNKLPLIAQEMAPIVNKVDYAKYRKTPDKFAYSFPGVIRTTKDSIRQAKSNKLKQIPEYVNEKGQLNLLGRIRADDEANAEMFTVLNAVEQEKQNNPSFSLEDINFHDFIKNNKAISPFIKTHAQKGVEFSLRDKQRFEEMLEKAETYEFKYQNPQTKQIETGRIMVMEATISPLKTTNIAYNYYTDRIIAAHSPKKGSFDAGYVVGVAAESLDKMRPVMRQICIKLNHIEEEKRAQLYNKPDKSAEDEEIIAKIEKAQSEKAFFDSDKFGLIDKLPALLVGGETLIVPSDNFTMIKNTDDFKVVMKDFAAKTQSLGNQKFKGKEK